MPDSLLIDDTFELLGGGAVSQLPQCPGAKFTLASGFDFGEPQPQVDIVGNLLLDGERPRGRRAGNRTFKLPVIIRAPDRGVLSAAREALLQAIEQDKFPVKWTREGGNTIVFDCFRATPTVIDYNLKRDRQCVSNLEISFPALPYGYSAEPETVAFATSVQSVTPPANPVELDNFSSVNTSFTGFTQSSVHVADSSSARWFPNTTSYYNYYNYYYYSNNGIGAPSYSASFTAKDLSSLKALSLYVGLGTRYYSYWSSGSVTFSWTLTDSAGRHISFGNSQYCSASNDENNPLWQQVTVTIPSSATFDFAHVTKYAVQAYVGSNSGGPYLPAVTYFNGLFANPGSRPQAVASTRGAVYTLFGIKGTARAPMSVQLQQGSLAAFKTMLIHRPGVDAPTAFQPLVPVGGGANPPDGREYSIAGPAAGLPAKFAGTYTIMAAASNLNTPTTVRTVTITIKQYDYSGGPSTTVTTSRALTPTAETPPITNGLVVVGELTLPIKEIASDNTEAFFTVAVSDTNANDRWMDVIFIDTTGQTVAVNVASGSGYSNFFVDEPGSDVDESLILGSQAGRSRATSVMDQLLTLGGGPLVLDPGDNRFLCYAVEGAPGLVVTYRPRWRIDRTD